LASLRLNFHFIEVVEVDFKLQWVDFSNSNSKPHSRQTVAEMPHYISVVGNWSPELMMIVISSTNNFIPLIDDPEIFDAK